MLSASQATLVALIVLSALVVVLGVLYRREAVAKTRLLDTATRGIEVAPRRPPDDASPNSSDNFQDDGQRDDLVDGLPGQTRPIIDQAALDDLMDALGPEDFAQVVDVFLSDMPPLMARLASAVAARDGAAVFAIAHDGKGTAASLGLTRLADVMAQIETAARTDRHNDVEVLLAEAERVWTESAYALDSAHRG